MNYQNVKLPFAPEHASLATRTATARRSETIAPTAEGVNFFEADHSLKQLLPQYLDQDLLSFLTPHFNELGNLLGHELSEFSDQAERHSPKLSYRDRSGRDNEWIEFHPAYREMEKIAYGRFGIHAIGHREGVLGYPSKMPSIVKYVFQYLFSQTEFGLLCPVNMAGSASELLRKYGSEELRTTFLDRMLTQNMDELLRSAQFMTEKAGGSDVGRADLVAVRQDNVWRLWGEKWFCSNVDADVVVLLARPEGAVAGGKGLGLFFMPKMLSDGTRNSYRIVRIKDKLGSKSMASGEVLLEGAVAYELGDLNKGLKHMLEMVNSSRLSHLARAAGMMRRCVNEALAAASNRDAFGKTVIDHPLMRRQLMKMIVPTEQSLSALLFTGSFANSADAHGGKVLRIMTALSKYRACRDNITVATSSMEARGGNGYIEDWPNAKLVRDSHLGVLWDGTSNINALDVIQRTVGKEEAHLALESELMGRLGATGLPGQFKTQLEGAIQGAVGFATEVASSGDNERFARLAAGRLYHATTAIVLAMEGAKAGRDGGDARRLLLSRFVLEHRFDRSAALNLDAYRWEEQAISLVLGRETVSLSAAEECLRA